MSGGQTESAGVRILHMLAEHPEGLHTTEMAQCIPTGYMPELSSSQAVKRRLNALQLAGYVKRSEQLTQLQGHGHYQHHWHITADGVAWLAAGCPSPGIAAWRRAQERSRAAIAKWETAVQRRAALMAAADRYGPDTPVADRPAITLQLREAGCTFAESGSVFGVTRERARQYEKAARMANPSNARCTCPQWWQDSGPRPACPVHEVGQSHGS